MLIVSITFLLELFHFCKSTSSQFRFCADLINIFCILIKYTKTRFINIYLFSTGLQDAFLKLCPDSSHRGHHRGNFQFYPRMFHPGLELSDGTRFLRATPAIGRRSRKGTDVGSQTLAAGSFDPGQWCINNRFNASIV